MKSSIDTSFKEANLYLLVLRQLTASIHCGDSLSSDDVSHLAPSRLSRISQT